MAAKSKSTETLLPSKSKGLAGGGIQILSGPTSKRIFTVDTMTDTRHDVQTGAGKADTVELTTTCTGGHGLQSFSTPTNSYYCDKCKKRFPKNTILFGCRTCDFDACGTCVPSEYASSQIALFHSANACPAGHDLVGFNALSNGYNCNRCTKKFTKGTRLCGCRECNYDVCSTCMPIGIFTEKTKGLDKPAISRTPHAMEYPEQVGTLPIAASLVCAKESMGFPIEDWTFSDKLSPKTKEYMNFIRDACCSGKPYETVINLLLNSSKDMKRSPEKALKAIVSTSANIEQLIEQIIDWDFDIDAIRALATDPNTLFIVTKTDFTIKGWGDITYKSLLNASMMQLDSSQFVRVLKNRNGDRLVEYDIVNPDGNKLTIRLTHAKHEDSTFENLSLYYTTDSFTPIDGALGVRFPAFKVQFGTKMLEPIMGAKCGDDLEVIAIQGDGHFAINEEGTFCSLKSLVAVKMRCFSSGLADDGYVELYDKDESGYMTDTNLFAQVLFNGMPIVSTMVNKRHCT